MNMPTPELFAAMTWSHNQVLSETVRRLVRLGIEYCLLPEWLDIDCAEDITALGAIRDPAVKASMKRTRSFVAQLISAGPKE